MENVKLNKIAERAASFGLEVVNRPETTAYGAFVHIVEFRRPKVEAKNWLDVFNNTDSVVIAGYYSEHSKRWSTSVTRYTYTGNDKLKQKSVDFYIRLFADAI
jgi:hypothetical protein